MRMELQAYGSYLDWLRPKVQSVGDFIFFRLILDYLEQQIREFGIDLMGRSMQWVGGIALTLLTLWIIIQGWRIVTGQSREPMMALVTSSLRAVFILTAATTMAMFGSDLHQFLNTDVKNEINQVVTGDDGSPEDQIDKNLAWMQVALSSIDALDAVGDSTLDGAKTRAMWFVGLGTGGPAITAGTMLLLYQVALALFIGLGPIFILCLLFDQTKQLFGKWLYYGIGTMFSMAVLSVMVSISLEMVTRVSASFWASAAAGALMGSDFTDGMTSQAMQQGGMGLILTTLIVTTPPMAAAFFQGTLGQFSPYVAFAAGGASASSSYPPGQGPVQNTVYSTSAGSSNAQRSDPGNAINPVGTRVGQPTSSAEANPGQRGLAERRET